MTELRGKRVTNERLAALNLPKLQQLHLLGTSITDEGMAVLAEAVNLREVLIDSQLITDRSMEVLCALPQLVSLFLDEVPLITDAGVAHLQRRTELRELRLKGTHLSDRGVRSFTHLQGLWSVGLSKTLVTDRGVADLAAMRKLSLLSLDDTVVVGDGLCSLPVGNQISIYLDNCPVTDAAVIAFCQHLIDLKDLSLLGTPITDRCLPALASLPRLEMLRLTKTAVTDAGIESLIGHPSLSTIEVCETAVSEEAKKKLKAASPHDLTVIR